MSHVYDFLEEGRHNRHVVVVGDLNHEPFDAGARHLYAERSRSRVRAPAHPADEDVRRVRLYNCAWRLIGERRVDWIKNWEQLQVAGTYYNRRNKKWATVDHVLVNGSLLGRDPPHLDEETLQTFVHPGNFAADFLPAPFQWDGKSGIGASDHLPIVGELLFP
jgi:endonuclease/exonuclease/phosphatase family metal-dependent hydrolase